MEVQYRHNLQNNYIIIKSSKIYVNDYRLNMVLKNDIRGLLSMCAGCVDGEVELSYIISSKQSIKDLYEKKKMAYDDILNVLNSIISVCHEIQIYLLKLGDVIFDTELAYFDYGSGEVDFCYYPNRDCESEHEIRNFIQELMRMTDHEDRRAVELIYGVFDICNRDNFLISDVEEYINNGKEINLKKKPAEDIYLSEINYSNEVDVRQKKQLPDKVCESSNAGYDVSDAQTPDVYEQDMKNILKNNIVLRKLTEVFSKEKIQSRNIPDRIYREKSEESYDGHSKSVQNKKADEKHSDFKITSNDNTGDDTMYIKDIIHNTTRKLLSLTEKENIEIMEYPFIIGKLCSRVDYVLDDKTISRIHVKISRDEEGNYYMEDMNSKNGTYLNGIPAEPHEKIKIEIGDKIRIAAFEYIFR